MKVRRIETGRGPKGPVFMCWTPKGIALYVVPDFRAQLPPEVAGFLPCMFLAEVVVGFVCLPAIRHQVYEDFRPLENPGNILTYQLVPQDNSCVTVAGPPALDVASDSPAPEPKASKYLANR